ncbi:hypothetical protein QNH14_05000 [Apirhabdus apintestini]|nr:hypothetical protein QNH14_05000 [Enterobacteriaceae bacterium CA-0114]
MPTGSELRITIAPAMQALFMAGRKYTTEFERQADSYFLNSGDGPGKTTHLFRINHGIARTLF